MWTCEVSHPFGASGLEVRRHRLHNGLTLLVLADAGAPIVSFQTWYAVGSRHERLGATGMAHLFEHLMFNQTRSRPPGVFDRLIERTGGDTNASITTRSYFDVSSLANCLSATVGSVKVWTLNP